MILRMFGTMDKANVGPGHLYVSPIIVYWVHGAEERNSPISMHFPVKTSHNFPPPGGSNSPRATKKQKKKRTCSDIELGPHERFRDDPQSTLG